VVRFLTTLLLVAAVATPAAAGPWTKSPGELYVKVGESFFVSDSYVDSSGTVHEGTRYTGASTFAYYEIGFAPKLQVMGYLPFTIARNDFPDGSAYLQSGGADALIGLQWSPPIPVVQTAVRADVKIPMYDVGALRGPAAMSFPAFGDGQVDVTLWWSAGGGLPSTPLYLWGEAGYRIRTEGYVGTGDTRAFADSFVWAGQLGVTVPDKLWVAVTANGVAPFRQDEVTKGYLTVGPSVGVRPVTWLAIEASFDPIVWAHNSSPGVGFGAGVSVTR